MRFTATILSAVLGLSAPISAHAQGTPIPPTKAPYKSKSLRTRRLPKNLTPRLAALSAAMGSQISDNLSGLSLLFDGGIRIAFPAILAQVSAPDKEATLVDAWKEHIKEIDPAAAGFLGETGTEIKIADPSPGVVKGEGQIAQYELGKVYVNRAVLAQHSGELARRAPPEEQGRALALLTSPIIAHELRHGITRAKMRSELGFDYPLGSQEDELIAFYHQAAAAKRLYEKHGSELAKYPVEMGFQNRNLLFRLSIGVTRNIGALGGLKSFVDTNYRENPSMIEADRETFLRDRIVYNIADEENRISAFEAAGVRISQELADSKFPERKRLLEAKLASLDAERAALEQELGKLKQARAVAGDADKFRRLQEFYKREIEALESDWQASHQPAGNSSD